MRYYIGVVVAYDSFVVVIVEEVPEFQQVLLLVKFLSVQSSNAS
jgi:hypothetical protein